MLKKIFLVTIVFFSLAVVSCKKNPVATLQTISSFQLISPLDTTIAIDSVNHDTIWFTWQTPTDISGNFTYYLYLAPDSSFNSGIEREVIGGVDSLALTYSYLYPSPLFPQGDTAKTKTLLWTVFVNNGSSTLRSQDISKVTITIP